MLIVRQGWSTDGTSSGPLTALELTGQLPTWAALYLNFSTLASTQSWSFQTAQDSSGPWLSLGGTSNVFDLSTAVTTNAVLKSSGPVGPWLRPVLNSAASGAYNFLLVGTD